MWWGSKKVNLNCNLAKNATFMQSPTNNFNGELKTYNILVVESLLRIGATL